jgi:hypothetical protein
MNHEAVAKLAQLLQSHRIAANVVLGFLLLVAATGTLASVFDLRATVAEVPALGAAPFVLALVSLLGVVSYSVAHLLLSGFGAVYRLVAASARNRRARREAEAEKEIASKSADQARRRAERNMRSVVRHLPGSHLKVLLVLNESENQEARVSRSLAPYEVVSELTKHGLVSEIAKFGKDSYLLRLTRPAQPIVADFFEERRRQESAARRERIEQALLKADEATMAFVAASYDVF